MNEELNRKLAEWAGFELLDTQFYSHSFGGDAEVETWLEPSGLTAQGGYPNFTESLDACIQHLWPKLEEELSGVDYFELLKGWVFQVVWSGGDPALAFCKALEKRMRNEG